MLAKGGAYSKRYQAEEREIMKQWQSMSGRNTRDREHALSKQTAQRQKALERKKRAMAQAEEDRRRKALEERRQAQREATERCKMAISRLKGSSRSVNHHSRDIPLEIHYTNLPQQKETNHISFSFMVSGKREGGGRVVLGSNVELRQDTVGARKPPSLDEVLRSIRGHPSSSPAPPSPSPSPTPSTINQPASVPDRQGTDVQSSITLKRSYSDPDVVNQFPVYKVYQAREDRSNTSKDTFTALAEKDSTQEACDTKLHETGEMVFHPVVRGPPRTRFEVPRETSVMRIVSPSQDSSSSSSPLDSLSGDDTADSTSGPSPARQVIRKHRGSSTDAKKVVEKNSVALKREQAFSDRSTSARSLSPELSQLSVQNDYTYTDSSSEDESAPPHFSPPQRRRQQKLHPRKTTGVLHNYESQLSGELQGPKIVGILKKTLESSAKSSTNETSGKQDKRHGKVENGFIVSAIPSHASSTTSSTLALEQHREEGDGHSMISDPQISRDTITMSSASTTKRVRFSDNLESSLNSSQTSVSQVTPQLQSINSAVELWKQVLPSGLYGRHTRTPNGFFSPKMKISLSQKAVSGSRSHKPPLQSDRITVHVPQTTGYLALSNGQQKENGTEDNGENTDRNYKASKDDSSVEKLEQGKRTVEQGSTAQTNGSSETSLAQERSNSIGEREKSSGLDLSPTDAQIDGIWDEIQMQLYSREKVTLAPQVYQFQPDPQRGGISTRVDERGCISQPQKLSQCYSNVHSDRAEQESVRGRKVGGGGKDGQGEGGTRHLPHRSRQRPLRCQGGTGHHTHAKTSSTTVYPHQMWAGPAQQSHLHPNSYHQPESSYVSTQPSSWEPRTVSTAKPGVTGLSHDEQRLMRSIEKINQRLRDHVIVHEGSHSHTSHPHLSHPPHHHYVFRGNSRT